jgi:hypothetical protein
VQRIAHVRPVLRAPRGGSSNIATIASDLRRTKTGYCWVLLDGPSFRCQFRDGFIINPVIDLGNGEGG